MDTHPTNKRTMDFDNCKGFVRGNEPPEERARKYAELLKGSDEEAILMGGVALRISNEESRGVSQECTLGRG
jgi:hypothetical protein